MNTYLAKLVLVSIAVALIGCSSEDPICGSGESTTVDGAEYCYYRSAITEEGFRCPEARPFRHDFDRFSVCSGEMNLPDGIEERIRRLLGDGSDAGTDAGTDASMDVASDMATDGSGFMCPSELGGLEGTACTEEGVFCGGEACEGPCQFCNVLQCSGGTWMRLEAPPAPCFACGETQCQNDVEFCHEMAPGIPGPSSFECRAAPDSCGGVATCACVTAADVSISDCSEASPGEVSVMAAAP